jgi:uncharacterized membrane protein YhaH (DUF805 family)
MTFEDAVVSAVRRYADFRSRARPSEYWWWQLFMLLLVVAVGAMAGLSPVLAGWMFIGLVLAAPLPTLSLTVRRMHDVGWSGLWLIALIPFPVLLVPLAVLLAMPGAPDANRYGPSPGRAALRPVERATNVPTVRRR